MNEGYSRVWYLPEASPSYTCRALNPYAVLGVDACWMHTASTSQNVPKKTYHQPRYRPSRWQALLSYLLTRLLARKRS